MTNVFKPVTLYGKSVTLVPLAEYHHDDLVIATQDGELWKLWYTFVPEPSLMKENINTRLSLQERGSMLPFAVIDNNTQKAVGMTSYVDIDRPNKRVEIGWTWYRKGLQRTALNTECNLLLLTHAFETMNCIAVEWRTHSFNMKSRIAIERIGAKLDGILRNHMIMPNGTVRDTYVYSIIASEWPTVKAHLIYMMDRFH